jgi:hypothetical protein
MAKYTPDELEELSEDELEGLKELEEEIEEEEAGETEDDDGSATDDAGKADDEAEDKADEGKADGDEETDASGSGKQDDAADDEGNAGGSDNKAPKPSFVAPDDLDQKLGDIETRKDELATKFDDGELTAAEYRAQLKEIDKQERDLYSQKIRAEVSHDMVVSQWRDSVSSFLGKHTQYEQGTPLYTALDAEVRRLQGQSDNPFDPDILGQAHRTIDAQMRKAMGLPPEETPRQESKTDPAAKKPAGRKPLADIPPTLAQVPAADITDTDGGEFAHLDRLDGEKFEAALARLTDEQRDRYLASM